MATSGRLSGQISAAMAPDDRHWVRIEGSGEKSGGHRASCSPSHTVSGCLGDDQPRSFDHLRSIPSASALRDRWREQVDCAGAAARLADAVEARADVVSATTMRDGDTSSQNLKTLFENGDECTSHGPERLGISIPGPSSHAGIVSTCDDGAIFKILVENKILLLHSSRILARSEH